MPPSNGPRPDGYLGSVLDGGVLAAPTPCGASTSQAYLLPRFVKDKFEAFLECGILAHGILRLRCGKYANDTLLAFPASAAGFRPWCGARRISHSLRLGGEPERTTFTA